MAFDSFYDVGAVSVPAGGTAVTGTGTLWSDIVLPGDTFEAAGLMARIAAVGGDGSLTFVKGWAGATLTDADYSITFNSPLRFDGAYVAEQARALITRLALLDSASPVYSCLGVGTNAPPGAPAEGDTFVVGAAPTGAWVGATGLLASWTGTAWSFTVPEAGWRADDVSVDPPTAYVRGAAAWVLKSEASNLSDLQDVDLTGIADGDVLGFAGGIFGPITPAASVSQLNDLLDVDMTGRAEGDVLTVDAEGNVIPLAPATPSIPAVLGRNLLFNPCGLVNQRGAASKADNAYGFDRWVVLTQSGAVALATLTAPADGVGGMMRLTQSQAAAQRMGQIQFLEAHDSRWMRGRTMTLSGEARCSAAATLRYAILSWEGTADSPTKDVVLDWTSGSHAAGGFFLAAGLGVVAVGSLALSAGVITSMAALSAAMPSGLNNAAVVYWTEGALAQDVTLDAALQLEEGDAAHPLDIRPASLDLALCRRYFQVIGTGEQAYEQAGLGIASSATELRVPVVLSPVMRRAPTITLSNNSHWAIAGTAGAISGFSTEAVTKQSAMLKPAVASGLTTNAAYRFEAFGTTSARIFLDAEF